jgi:hypothetical protein
MDNAITKAKTMLARLSFASAGLPVGSSGMRKCAMAENMAQAKKKATKPRTIPRFAKNGFESGA